jgi:hypothetical protein
MSTWVRQTGARTGARKGGTYAASSSSCLYCVSRETRLRPVVCNFEQSLSAQNSTVRKFAPRCNQKIRRFEIIKTIIDLHSGRIAYPVFDLSEILERAAGRT